MKKLIMKKLIFFAIAFMFFGCSEKNVTQKSITRSESKEEKKEEKSIKETLAEELLAEFQDDLESWNACIIYDGYEYTSLEDFRNRDN